jgi:hypothetical protein
VRETSLVLGLAQDIAIVVVLGTAVFVAFRIGKDDPEWERRWRELSPADRRRLAVAASSGALLADPGEIELAAGYARHDRRRRPFTDVWILTLALVGLALLLAGLISGHAILIAFGCFFILRTAWTVRHQFEVGRNLREAISRDREPSH